MYSTAVMKLNLKNQVQFELEQGASKDRENRQLIFKKFSRITNIFKKEVQFLNVFM